MFNNNKTISLKKLLLLINTAYAETQEDDFIG